MYPRLPALPAPGYAHKGWTASCYQHRVPPRPAASATVRDKHCCCCCYDGGGGGNDRDSCCSVAVVHDVVMAVDVVVVVQE